MRLATNPIVLRMALVFVAAGFAFIVGLLVMRRMRRSISEEASFPDASASAPESFPLHTYHAVIQQLKQQKHELQSLQLLERRRAKTSENISAAVLSNLSSRRALLHSQRVGAAGQCFREADSRIRFARRDERG